MNYCPYCGSSIESSWKVCAHCGQKLVDEEVSTVAQKEPEVQNEKVEAEVPKPVVAQYKPQAYQASPTRANGITALIVGIIGIKVMLIIGYMAGIINIDFIRQLIMNSGLYMLLKVSKDIFGYLELQKK